MYVGVDGCKQGWVAVSVTMEGFSVARVFADFDRLLAAFAGVKTIGVDIPIGLLASEPRVADEAARKFLPGNASSVFPAPVRPALEARSHDEANRISKKVSGKGLSAQTYNLFVKIREVDAHAKDTRIHEVHPEVSFRTMGEGRPLQSKKTWGGMKGRLALLAREGIVLPDELGDVDAVGIDDVIDAAGAAWSARRVGQGIARRFGDARQLDPRHGRIVAIWA